MSTMFYAELTPDPDGGFVVTFPDVPEAITGGGTRAEALDMAADALAVALLGRLDDGVDLPVAKTKNADLIPVTVPARFAAKIAVIQAFRTACAADSMLNQSELARRLGVDHKEIRRRLDPNHKTKLPALEKTLKALGKRLVLQVEDAAWGTAFPTPRRTLICGAAPMRGHDRALASDHAAGVRTIRGDD